MELEPRTRPLFPNMDLGKEKEPRALDETSIGVKASETIIGTQEQIMGDHENLHCPSIFSTSHDLASLGRVVPKHLEAHN